LRILVLILLPWIAIFLQSNVFSYYNIKGTIPDLVLVFVTFYTLFNGIVQGTVYAFACGLLEDLYMGRFIGMNALAKGLTAYIISRVEGNLFKENLFVGILSVLLATFLNSFLLFLLSLLMFEVFHIDLGMIYSIIYQAIYNIIVAIPLYVWYYNSAKSGVLSTSRRVK
jgi:rod shape-determining protein MreD